MKRRSARLLLVLLMLFGLFHGRAQAESRSTLPEGVTEIDLRDVLGDDAQDVWSARMVNADICVLLRALPEQANENIELIVLNMRELSILSRTPVPYAASLLRQSRKDGRFYGQGMIDDTFYLLFKPECAYETGGPYGYMYDPEITYIKAVIAADGTVELDLASSKLTVMPGGKTAVRDGYYGSLYALDLETGEEELLIRGTADPYATVSYEAYLQYVPFWDDAGFYEEDENGNPLPITFPLDETSFMKHSPFFFHGFTVVKPLDAHRFVYAGYGWEWRAGFGIYDLETRTDHRITGRGAFFGMRGSTLFGTALQADANTYETTQLPQAVQWQLANADYWEYGSYDYDISPDGNLLAFTDTESTEGKSISVRITDICTGDIVKTYDIDKPFMYIRDLAFYDDTRFMLFCVPEESESATIFLFDEEK